MLFNKQILVFNCNCISVLYHLQVNTMSMKTKRPCCRRELSRDAGHIQKACS